MSDNMIKTQSSIYAKTLKGQPVDSIKGATSNDCARQKLIIGNSIASAMFPALYKKGPNTDMTGFCGNANGRWHILNMLNGPYRAWVLREFSSKGCSLGQFSDSDLSPVKTMNDFIGAISAKVSCTKCGS